MQVVVRTTDRVVVNYVCTGDVLEPGRNTFLRTEVRSKGGFTWHVVGGVAPYRVVNYDVNASGGCITVMDANGTLSSGCGTIGYNTSVARIDCQWDEFQPDSSVYRQAPTGNVSFNYPVRGYTPATETGYRPPVKSPAPDSPEPPVDPEKEKDPVHTPRPNDNPAPPPTPRPDPVPVRNPGHKSPTTRTHTPTTRTHTPTAPQPYTPATPGTSQGNPGTKQAPR